MLHPVAWLSRVVPRKVSENKHVGRCPKLLRENKDQINAVIDNNYVPPFIQLLANLIFVKRPHGLFQIPRQEGMPIRSNSWCNRVASSSHRKCKTDAKTTHVRSLPFIQYLLLYVAQSSSLSEQPLPKFVPPHLCPFQLVPVCQYHAGGSHCH